MSSLYSMYTVCYVHSNKCHRHHHHHHHHHHISNHFFFSNGWYRTTTDVSPSISFFRPRGRRKRCFRLRVCVGVDAAAHTWRCEALSIFEAPFLGFKTRQSNGRSNGNNQHRCGKIHNSYWQNPLQMVIFSSYVKLPEGRSNDNSMAIQDPIVHL